MHDSTELARKLSIAEIMGIVAMAKADMLRACAAVERLVHGPGRHDGR